MRDFLFLKKRGEKTEGERQRERCSEMRGSAALQTYSSVFSGHLTLFPVELAVLLLQLLDPGEESLTLLYGSPQLLSLPHPCLLSAIVLVRRLWSSILTCTSTERSRYFSPAVSLSVTEASGFCSLLPGARLCSVLPLSAIHY